MADVFRVAPILFLVLVACLPFEFQSFPVFSSLQWLFVGVAVTFTPILIRNRSTLLRDRVVIAALFFAATQWLAVLLADEFRGNAILGATRVTIGCFLLCASISMPDRPAIMRVWCVTAVCAAIYALLDYYGLGVSGWFRAEEFWVGAVQRLSGSFEYPNTAAAFFAMSLPIVWYTTQSLPKRIGLSLLLSIVLLLTYSRGSVLAVLIASLTLLLPRTPRKVLVWAGLAGAVPAVVLILRSSLPEGLQNRPPFKAFAATYEPEFNSLRRSPGDRDELNIRITNAGTVAWLPDDPPFLLSYRWVDPIEKKLVVTEKTFTTIPVPLGVQESVMVRAPFFTPDKPGLYLLTWDTSQNGRNWFAGQGVWPGLVQVEIQIDGEPFSGQEDLSRWFDRETSRLFVANVPLSRRELWAAALHLIRENPIFGSGPDSFRLLYGRIFGLTRWNTKAHANNLYLELWTGSGIVGLTGFIVMMGFVRWRASAPHIALATFLMHGLVDSFLMTTPIYFAFWILLGRIRGGDI